MCVCVWCRVCIQTAIVGISCLSSLMIRTQQWKCESLEGKNKILEREEGSSAGCIFAHHQLGSTLQTPKTSIFSLQLGVIAVRVEAERVLKLPSSLYLPLTRLSCDWIITPLPPRNCRSLTPPCFDGVKNGGRENVSRIITVCRSQLWFLCDFLLS